MALLGPSFTRHGLSLLLIGNSFMLSCQNREPATGGPAHAKSQGTPIATHASKAQWLLKGGLISGGFIQAEAQKAWPGWYRFLVGQGPRVDREELKETDLHKIPDVLLMQALQRLESVNFYSPSILKQLVAIQHAADAPAFQAAKTAYLRAYGENAGLPVEDVETASQFLTELKREGHEPLVRELLIKNAFPKENPSLHRAFLRMLEERPSAATVLDSQRPDIERLYAFTRVATKRNAEKLLASFKDSPLLNRAAHMAVQERWISLDHPLVVLATRNAKGKVSGPWFMVRPIERASDLGWMRAIRALEKGDQAKAINAAKDVLKAHPESYYAGHAIALISALSPKEGAKFQQEPRIPSDLTAYNVGRFLEELKHPEASWPEKYQTWAQEGRFDLILLNVDPLEETQLYLSAAQACGQMDLVSRFMSVERRFQADTLPYAYPMALENLIARLIQEEGVGDLVDPAFVMGMMKNESQFQPRARSAANACGLVQLLPGTFKAMVGRSANIWDPETNIRAALRYYATISRTAGLYTVPAEVRHAYIVAGYHAGEGRAKRWKRDNEKAAKFGTDLKSTLLRMEAIPIQSTRNYVARVNGDARIYRKLLAERGK